VVGTQIQTAPAVARFPIWNPHSRFPKLPLPTSFR